MSAAPSTSVPPRPLWRRWSRRTLLVVAVLVGVAAVLRVAAPYVIREVINRRLAQIEGYRGHVEDVDLGLWRGGYRIDGFQLRRQMGELEQPFAAARRIDFSLAWRELFRGRILSEITAEDVTMTYVPVPEDTPATPIDAPRWQDVIQDLFPIEITQFDVHRGSIRWLDKSAEPAVDVGLEALELTATGLRNRPSPNTALPATITVHGTTVGGGRVALDARADPLALRPRFDLNLAIENVSLPALNDYLKAYANVDVSQGRLLVYAEFTAGDGAFEGYVKPFFEDVSFEDRPGADQPVLTRVWETLVSAVASLLKNKSRDQLGTRIPVSGRLGDPDVGFWATLGNLFRHGFVRALSEGLEGTADPGEAEKSDD